MIDDIKYDRLMRRIDLRDVLEELDIEYIEEGPELRIECTNPDHIDHNPSCTINSDNESRKFGWYNCFGCGDSGALSKFIARTKKISFQAARKYIVDNFSTRVFDKDGKVRLSKIRKESTKKVLIELPDEFRLIKSNSSYEKYLLKRGVLFEHIEEYGWGFCATGRYKKRVMLPIHIKRELEGFYARHISSDLPEKKVRNARFSSFKNLVFPYDRINYNLDWVWVTESAFNYFKLIRLGLDNVVVLFGNQLTPFKQEFLKKFEQVRLVPDGDQGGKDLVVSCIKYLKDVEILMVDMIDDEDAASIRLKELKDVLETLHGTDRSMFSVKEDYDSSF